MADYRVNLDIFAGPLDLLLYLVRKEEVDIYDIPIAKITDQYVKYIELMKELDIDVAGDFLVMAATLMQIKSAMLLPREPGEALGEEDLSDPRAELIRQLLEYKKFKDAANLLAAAADERGERFNRPDTIIEQIKGATEPTIDLDQISIWDLLDAFDKIMEATGAKFDISNITDDTPIDLYQIEILHRLQTDGPTGFARIFEGRASRLVMVGLFLAILELIRSQLVRAELPQGDSVPVNPAVPAQKHTDTPQADSAPSTSSPQATNLIYLRAMTTEPAEEAVRKAILAVETATAASSPAVDNAALGTPDGEQKSVEEQPPIPIVEIPADETKPRPCGTKKQSSERLEPMEGGSSREPE
ncbi:MAG: segregation/condensation protein A [Sedimentisphaerales bacterium]